MQRRMFSPEIVESEEFLSMPPSAQNLYFHLGMNGDDDGFIQPQKIMRQLGSVTDDLKVLLAKRFLLNIEDGVMVIKHWLIHNMIRADRYKPTRFQEQKKMLYIKENNAYTDNPDNGILLLATKWQPNGNQMAPQVRLGKVRLGKNKEESQNKNFAPPSLKVLKPKTEKGWRDLRRAELGKPPTITPRTQKQDKVFAALKWKDYFREQGQEQHGMQFFLVKNEKREKAVNRLVITAHELLTDKVKDLVDWWFAGAGEWAEYEPEQCFMGRTIERFLNKGKKKDNRSDYAKMDDMFKKK